MTDIDAITHARGTSLARRMFWWGVGLTAVGLLWHAFGFFVLFQAWGQAGLNTIGYDIIAFVILVAESIGIASIGLSFLVRLIEKPLGDPDEQGQLPPRLSSRAMVIIGSVLVVIGWASAMYLDRWIDPLAGTQSVGLDILNMVSPFFKVVALPLGALLLPSAFVARMLENRRAAPEATEAERITTV